MLIKQFYKNQDVFITGGTGFIGKALIEKLLRSCPEVGRVFVLIRGKKGKSAEERLRGVLKEQLFDRLRREQPQTFKKVYAITGECSELGLGISAEQLNLIQDVSIIFHSAASVRFDDPLKTAVLLNTRGTHELIKIAETLYNLKVFVHVSTTYCNPDKHVVEEKVYPPYADWRTTVKLAEAFDTDVLNTLNKKYGDNQPNTYTFTKSLSEQVVNDYKDKLPLVIFRPSIVISSIEEPVPGYVDNFNGPVGMLIGCGMGIMRTNHADPDLICDYMPVDIVARALLVAAFKKGMEYQKYGCDVETQLPVFNCASGQFSTLTVKEVVEIGRQLVLKNPFETTLWVPGGGITRCRYWNFIRVLTLHVFMALVIDMGLKLAKRKPMVLKLQRRIFEATVALNYFMTTAWEFKNQKFYDLNIVIPTSEVDQFGYMKFTENIDPVAIFSQCLRGARVFLLKETPDCSPGARKRLEVLKALQFLTRFMATLFIVRFVMRYMYFNFSA